MPWRMWSPIKKGALVGLLLGLLMFVVLFGVYVKLLVIDTGVTNAGADAVNSAAWGGIYVFYAALAAGVVGVPATLVLMAIGAGIGWLVKKSKPQPPVQNPGQQFK